MSFPPEAIAAGNVVGGMRQGAIRRAIIESSSHQETRLEYLIKQYPLDTGALEIQYIEEYFGEFPRKKTAQEIINRLSDREFLILMARAPLPTIQGSSYLSPTRSFTSCAIARRTRSSPISSSV
jgi:hypothetical protein